MRSLLFLLLTVAGLVRYASGTESLPTQPERGSALGASEVDPQVGCSSSHGGGERRFASKHGTDEPLLETRVSQIEVEHEDREFGPRSATKPVAPWHEGGPLPPGFLPDSLCYLRTNGPANANGARA